MLSISVGDPAPFFTGSDSPPKNLGSCSGYSKKTWLPATCSQTRFNKFLLPDNSAPALSKKAVDPGSPTLLSMLPSNTHEFINKVLNKK